MFGNGGNTFLTRGATERNSGGSCGCDWPKKKIHYDLSEIQMSVNHVGMLLFFFLISFLIEQGYSARKRFSDSPLVCCRTLKMHHSSVLKCSFCQCSRPQSTCCPHQIVLFFLFFCLVQQLNTYGIKSDYARSSSSSKTLMWNLCAAPNRTGRRETRGSAVARRCCHGVAQARRVPRPFPLVVIG